MLSFGAPHDSLQVHASGNSTKSLIRGRGLAPAPPSWRGRGQPPAPPAAQTRSGRRTRPHTCPTPHQTMSICIYIYALPIRQLGKRKCPYHGSNGVHITSKSTGAQLGSFWPQLSCTWCSIFPSCLQMCSRPATMYDPRSVSSDCSAKTAHRKATGAGSSSALGLESSSRLAAGLERQASSSCATCASVRCRARATSCPAPRRTISRTTAAM